MEVDQSMEYSISKTTKCPFCFSANTSIVETDAKLFDNDAQEVRTGKYFTVHCKNCLASGPPMPKRAKANTAWKMRFNSVTKWKEHFER